MKLLTQLNDQNLLGQSGMSEKKPRIAVRGIIQTADRLFGVLHLEAFDLFSLPGGGHEEGETLEETLIREMREELGASITNIREIGMIEENRACHDFVQTDYYYTADVLKTDTPYYTKEEEAYRISIRWLSFDDLYRCIASPVHTSAKQRYIQARDKAALDEYRMKYL